MNCPELMVSCFLVALYILKAREKIGDTMQDRDPFLFGMFNIGWVWERSSCHFFKTSKPASVIPGIMIQLVACYPSSHNHGSDKWVPPIVVSFHLG